VKTGDSKVHIFQMSSNERFLEEGKFSIPNPNMITSTGGALRDHVFPFSPVVFEGVEGRNGKTATPRNGVEGDGNDGIRAHGESSGIS
jgi:hypothetical protein